MKRQGAIFRILVLKSTLSIISFEQLKSARSILVVPSILSIHWWCIFSASSLSVFFHSCGDGKCIDYTKVCNFVQDCADGYDELYCTSKCDFEDNTMCSWYNSYSLHNNMVWKLHRGAAFGGGGPSTDHTKGTDKGTND